MVNHCANSKCHKPLHYLRDGKIFLFSHKNSSAHPEGTSARLEHYWLCGICAKEWTLTTDGKDGVKLVKTRRSKFRASQVTPPYIASAS